VPVSRLLMRLRKLWAALTVPAYRRALRHGVAPSLEHDAVAFPATYRTVIDAGANRGQFALWALRRFPQARLLCFEPLPQAAARLRALVGHRAAVEVFEVALGAASAVEDFHVSHADDSSSLLRIGRQAAVFAGTAERETIRVRIRRLDEALGARDLPGPVLLKIDVQGGELALLQGAGTVLDAVDAVLVEASFVELYEGQPLVDDVWRLLHARGLRCRGVWSVVYGADGECLQADFLFAR
jgi:FkbM family methyltransferase